ncbi:MAG: DNA repair protein RecN [SAR202 cluster bacterium]|nr:DNA repair protein RecN [SAR202 cluster bacterium]
MLKLLTIRDFAIIGSAELEPGEGFTVLTGETGAGKSIIVDAIGLLLGAKADGGMVRAGAGKARLEAVISVGGDIRPAVEAAVGDMGFGDVEEEIIVSREISADGRSVSRLNGRITPLATLKRLGERRVDIHGQGQHLSLMRVAEHIDILDRYAGLWELRSAVARKFSELLAVRKKIADMDMSSREVARRVGLLEYQLGEIQGAKLSPGEDERLAQEHAIVSNARRLISLSGEAHALLGNSGAAVVESLRKAARLLGQIEEIDPSVRPLRESAESLMFQAEDLARSVRSYRDGTEYNPARLSEIEERLDLINNLKRKYGDTVEDVITFAQKASEELASLEGREQRTGELRGRESVLLSEAIAIAENLSGRRAAGAQRLGSVVQAELAALEMAGARVEIQVERFGGLSSTGIDKVEFLISANPGEPVQPVARIASGGETSRLMLAFRVSIAEADRMSSLVFDEIDAGIGGAAGFAVGKKLWELSRRRQVVCVTHLPQIAAFADNHVMVAKYQEAGRTVFGADRVTGAERVKEISRMIGYTGQATRDSAKEMLALAAEWKRGPRPLTPGNAGATLLQNRQEACMATKTIATAKTPITVISHRYIKDDVNSYGDAALDVAKEIDASLILTSFTGTSGEEKERWNWRLLPAFVENAHKRGLMVSFYMKFTNINWKTMWYERPESREWIMTYANGKPALYSGAPDRYMGCLNNPGWLEYRNEMIRKALEYKPDALFYDNCFIPRELKGSKEEGASSGWACYCKVCAVKFREYAKQAIGWECELPVTPDWDDPIWQAFINFRDKYFTDAMDILVKYAHSQKPDLLVYPNVAPPWAGGGGAKGSATNMIADKVDLLLLERSGAPRMEATPSGGTPRAIHAVTDWKYGSRLKDTPTWYRMNKPGSYTPDQMRVGLAEASAFNGATHHIMAAGLSREKEKSAAIRQHYQFLQQHPQYFAEVKPVADVAMHISMPTINWYLPDHAAMSLSGGKEKAELPMNVQGFSQALVEMHLPYNVVLDEDLVRGDHGYRVVVLPNSACMSDEQAAAVTKYVENGGSIVATNVTSLYDEKYRARQDFALAKVFGVHYGQKADAVVKHEYGKGRAAFITGPADEDFWKTGLPQVVAKFQEAMDYALRGDWQLKVDAPHTTIINVTETAGNGATLLHLINFEIHQNENQMSYQNEYMPNLALGFVRRVEGITATVRKPKGKSLKSINILTTDPDQVSIADLKEDAKTISFTVPVLRIWDLVVMEWK